jgi:hypothetical protein
MFPLPSSGCIAGVGEGCCGGTVAVLVGVGGLVGKTATVASPIGIGVTVGGSTPGLTSTMVVGAGAESCSLSIITDRDAQPFILRIKTNRIMERWTYFITYCLQSLTASSKTIRLRGDKTLPFFPSITRLSV